MWEEAVGGRGVHSRRGGDVWSSRPKSAEEGRFMLIDNKHLKRNGWIEDERRALQARSGFNLQISTRRTETLNTARSGSQWLHLGSKRNLLYRPRVKQLWLVPGTLRSPRPPRTRVVTLGHVGGLSKRVTNGVVISPLLSSEVNSTWSAVLSARQTATVHRRQSKYAWV